MARAAAATPRTSHRAVTPKNPPRRRGPTLNVVRDQTDPGRHGSGGQPAGACSRRRHPASGRGSRRPIRPSSCSCPVRPPVTRQPASTAKAPALDGLGHNQPCDIDERRGRQIPKMGRAQDSSCLARAGDRPPPAIDAGPGTRPGAPAGEVGVERRGRQACLQNAREVLDRGSSPRSWWTGADVERVWRNLHAADALLMTVRSPDDLRERRSGTRATDTRFLGTTIHEELPSNSGGRASHNLPQHQPSRAVLQPATSSEASDDCPPGPGLSPPQLLAVVATATYNAQDDAHTRLQAFAMCFCSGPRSCCCWTCA